MIISSRTPEGDANTCPICRKELRIDPSTFPIKDAPCPHCGHLLRFDRQIELDDLFAGSPYPSTFSTSVEKSILEVGIARLGPFPLELRDELLVAIALIALKHRLPDHGELVSIVDAAEDWSAVISSLLRIAAGSRTAETSKPGRTFANVFGRFLGKLVGGGR